MRTNADPERLDGPDGIWVELNYMLSNGWHAIATVMIKFHGHNYGASYTDAVRYGWLGAEDCELTEEQLTWLKQIEPRIKAHSTTRPADETPWARK